MTLSRRELLHALLGIPIGSALWGCEMPPAADPAGIAGGFVDPSVARGHRLRGRPPPDEAFDTLATREVDVAIVGAGPAGLSAAWQLSRRGVQDYALFELEPEPGGTSLSGRNEVTPYPWGAHYITSPLSHQRHLIALLRELDALEPASDGPHPRASEALSVRQPKERVFYKGFWYAGLYLRAGASAEDLGQLARFEAIIDHYARLRDGRGRRAFALPISACSDDAELTVLDRMPAIQWLARLGLNSARLLHFLDYGCRDDYGLRLEHTSAWALLHYHACRADPEHDWHAEVLTWPSGNGALITHLAQRAGPRIARGRLVLDVIPTERGVTLHVQNAASERLERVKARHAIVAAPRFVARHIVRPLREQRSPLTDFDYGAWLVANLTLRQRPDDRGSEEAWDNVLYDSPALGYVSATHQRGRAFGPGVFTYYLPLTDARASDGRKRLFERSYDQCRDVVLADLGRAHPELPELTSRIDIRRWGHGMIQPRVGSVWSPARRQAREPIGAIHFAHSDLSGIALFEEAFDQGLRAADEVAARVVTGGHQAAL